MRISDWSSDVCSSDLPRQSALRPGARTRRMVSDTIRRGGGACRTTHMEWAAPDVAAPRPSPPSPTPARAPARRHVRQTGPGANVPELGPMTASDILDGAFSILKAAPATIVAFPAGFAGPAHVPGEIGRVTGWERGVSVV